MSSWFRICVVRQTALTRIQLPSVTLFLATKLWQIISKKPVAYFLRKPFWLIFYRGTCCSCTYVRRTEEPMNMILRKPWTCWNILMR